jgi:hypothetical protein
MVSVKSSRFTLENVVNKPMAVLKKYFCGGLKYEEIVSFGEKAIGQNLKQVLTLPVQHNQNKEKWLNWSLDEAVFFSVMVSSPDKFQFKFYFFLGLRQ